MQLRVINEQGRPASKLPSALQSWGTSCPGNVCSLLGLELSQLGEGCCCSQHGRQSCLFGCHGCLMSSASGSTLRHRAYSYQMCADLSQRRITVIACLYLAIIFHLLSWLSFLCCVCGIFFPSMTLCIRPIPTYLILAIAK